MLEFVLQQIVEIENIEITGGRIWQLIRPQAIIYYYSRLGMLKKSARISGEN